MGSQGQLIHQDVQRDMALNKEMHIMNNNGEFSGALGLYWWLLAFRRQLKRHNKKVKCSYFYSPYSHAAGKSCVIPEPPKIRLRARTFPRRDCAYLAKMLVTAGIEPQVLTSFPSYPQDHPYLRNPFSGPKVQDP